MKTEKFKKELFSWGKACVIGLFFAFLVSALVVQPFTVKGSSMEPTLDGEDIWTSKDDGDKVLIFKSGYMVGIDPKYNDIVVIDSRVERERSLTDNFKESPLINALLDETQGNNYWIKRVIGVEGDKLEYRGGTVYRNGEALVEEYLQEEMLFPFEEVTVPKGHVFVMGDNRNESIDSREIGSIPKENVMGKVVLRYFPFNRVDTVE
ncbi:signal peptidase I [Sutcliffiella horikoshii]|uniref:Signal peptidase I n=1 Tax=Sutcliffiella horikoshii TaxID=79883 RepID=A0A5D4THX6_9BACI|nr:signal peptidase I [Sutcliffiella horikoshii]TYS74418.1 signal peptidase I [Sutcliffiella horikoshii]